MPRQMLWLTQRTTHIWFWAKGPVHATLWSHRNETCRKSHRHSAWGLYGRRSVVSLRRIKVCFPARSWSAWRSKSFRCTWLLRCGTSQWVFSCPDSINCRAEDHKCRQCSCVSLSAKRELGSLCFCSCVAVSWCGSGSQFARSHRACFQLWICNR